MKYALTFIILLCSLATEAQQTYHQIDILGTQREYYRYLPSGYTAGENLPVVLVLHGIGDNALNMSGVGFNQLADVERFIPVYFQGLPNGWGQNSWNNGTVLSSSGDDILFISSVIDQLEDSLDVDLSKVYCTGFSMGSIMTYTVASNLSDRIAAIACFSGTMSNDEINATGQLHPVPTLHCHGTADAQVPYSGTALPSLSLVEQTMDKNKTLNSWAGDSVITNIPDNASDGITIEKIVYNTTTELELWKMTNAGHIWPYQPVNDTSAILIAWNFFGDKTHPNPSTASAENLEFNFELKAYPNPVQNQLNIYLNLATEAHVSIQLLDLVGKSVANIHQGNLSKGVNTLESDLTELPSGIYFLNVTGLNSQETIKIIKQ